MIILSVMFKIEKGKLYIVTCPHCVEVRNKQSFLQVHWDQINARVLLSHFAYYRYCWDVNKSHCYYTILVDTEVWVKYHFTMMQVMAMPWTPLPWRQSGRHNVPPGSWIVRSKRFLREWISYAKRRLLLLCHVRILWLEQRERMVSNWRFRKMYGDLPPNGWKLRLSSLA